MNIKSKPLRKCVACNEMKEKQFLIRVAKSDGSVCIDESGKSNGRGCYVCKDINCVRLARKSRRIERAFGVKIPDEIYCTLEEMVSDEH